MFVLHVKLPSKYKMFQDHQIFDLTLHHHLHLLQQHLVVVLNHLVQTIIRDHHKHQLRRQGKGQQAGRVGGDVRRCVADDEVPLLRRQDARHELGRDAFEVSAAGRIRRRQTRTAEHRE